MACGSLCKQATDFYPKLRRKRFLTKKWYYCIEKQMFLTSLLDWPAFLRRPLFGNDRRGLIRTIGSPMRSKTAVREIASEGRFEPKVNDVARCINGSFLVLTNWFCRISVV